MKRSMILFALFTLVLLGCGSEGSPWRPEPVAPEPPEPFVCDADSSAPAAESLQWKRVAALSADLTRGLGLTSETLCQEVDVFDCVDVHRVTLGGNDPFTIAQYEPVASPLATTPAAIDRVVLTACRNAVQRDEAGAPVTFSALPPSAEPAARAQLDAQATLLYRRLLSRDPSPEELDALDALRLDPLGAPRDARELDLLTCFAIGTTTEMLLF